MKFEELIFGGASIGGLYKSLSEEEAFETLQTAWKYNFTTFDTALEYGAGESENRIGKFLQSKARDKFCILTKVGDTLVQDPSVNGNAWWPNQKGVRIEHNFTEAGIRQAVSGAKKRLRVEYLDAVAFHDLDKIILKDSFLSNFENAVNLGYPVLKKMKDSNEIGAIGMGVKQWEVCEMMLDRGLEFDYFMLQGNYTLLEQKIPPCFFHRCETLNIDILIAGPFASGILVQGPDHKDAKFHHVKASKKIRAKTFAIKSLCESYGVSLPAAAMQFPLRHPNIQSVVVGLASPQEVEAAVYWHKELIPEAFWADLEKLLPKLERIIDYAISDQSFFYNPTVDIEELNLPLLAKL